MTNENIVGIFCFFAYPFAVSWILFYFSNKGEEARENIERDRANLMKRKLQDCEKEVDFYKHRLKLMQAKEKKGENNGRNK